jgi:hypothetical protein
VLGSPPRYPTLLYIVQGWVPSRSQGRGPSRITEIYGIYESVFFHV